MKKLIVGAVVALAVSAFLPRAASADSQSNGIRLNGITLQGIQFNGITLQGVKLNGLLLNGPVSQGMTLNDVLPQGGERPAPQCTAADVDFSAVPLAKVTVRLPQQVR